MTIKIYLGIGRSDTSKAVGEKTKRYLPLEIGEANHTLFLGKSGFGKTTIMRALIEEIFITHYMKGIPAMIIVFEKKSDSGKLEKLKKVYYSECHKPEHKLYKKYGEGIWNYIKSYIESIEKIRQIRAIGDFGFGIPNILGIYYKYDKYGHTFLGRHGLKPYYFPTFRFVFRPRKKLHYIELANGNLTMCRAFKAIIPYSKLPFSFLTSLTYMSENSLYAQRLKDIWEFQNIKNPDKVIELAKSKEKNPDDPSTTFFRIAETMHRLKLDPLFGETDTFFCNLTTKAINVIDFSSNSDLTLEEEALIFRFIVEYAIKIAEEGIVVYLFVDEIQNYLQYYHGKWAVDKILREGRSLGINLITATQYMNGLPKALIVGASHVGIVGKLASHTDWKILSDLIEDFKDVVEPPEPAYTYAEYVDIRKKLKFKGWFSWDKDYTERIEYRQPQSL